MIFATASGNHRNLRRPGRRPGPVKYGLWEPSTPPARLGGKPINSRNLRCPGRPPDPVFCGIPGALGTRILRAQMASKKHCPSERFLGGRSKWRVLRAIPWDPLGSRFVGSGGGLEHRKKGCRGTGHVRSVVFYAVPGAPSKRAATLQPFGGGGLVRCRVLRCPEGPRGPVSAPVWPRISRAPGGFQKRLPLCSLFRGARKVSHFTLSRAPFWTRILRAPGGS